MQITLNDRQAKWLLWHLIKENRDVIRHYADDRYGKLSAEVIEPIIKQLEEE